MTEPRLSQRTLARWELVLALGLTAALACFHLRFFFYGGALWRDEVSTLMIALTGSFADLWANLHHDSFPILWHCLLRIWFYSGIGKTDQGMRGLGLLVGLLIVSTLWWNARRFGAAGPIVSLTLLGFANANLCYVDSLRAYGIGSLTGLIALGATWELSQTVNSRTVVTAATASFLAVNALYYNSVLVLAGTCGAIGVCLIHRNHRRALLVCTIGGGCGAWMLLYRNVIHGRNLMAPVFRAATTYGRVLSKQHDSLMATPTHGDWLLRPDIIWICGLATALVIGIFTIERSRRSTAHSVSPGAGRAADMVIFSIVTLAIGIPTYWTFLVVLKYTMQPWYFLVLMAMVATCVEALFAAGASPARRLIVLTAALVIASLTGTTCWRNAGVEMTNIDFSAGWLEVHAATDDLIIISPWWLGVPFGRYYHGNAPWTMIPRISKWDFQRTDLYQQAVKNPHAADEVLSRMTEVLKRGHKIWIVSVGTTPFSSPPRAVALAYPTGDPDAPYLRYWEDQIAQMLWGHSDIRGPLILHEDDSSIMRYEISGIFSATGWQD